MKEDRHLPLQPPEKGTQTKVPKDLLKKQLNEDNVGRTQSVFGSRPIRVTRNLRHIKTLPGE